MSEKITVTPTGEGSYGVTVGEGDAATSHSVTVPADLLEAWGLEPAREAEVVEESIRFLLEREPATSILSSFSLGIIRRYFPDYPTAMPRRLG